MGVDAQHEVGHGQYASGLFGPLGQFQAWAGEKVAKPRLFPLPRIAKAVEVEVPDRQSFGLVGFDDRVGRALDAPADTERSQQMPDQRRLAGAKVAMQRDERVAHRRAGSQATCECRGVALGAPDDHPARGILIAGFYNGRVTFKRAQIDPHRLLAQIRQWAGELGFSQIGVAGVDLSSAEPGLTRWLAQGFHGSMDYMAAHGLRRARPAELVPGTVSVLTARMDYLPRDAATDWHERERARFHLSGEGIVSIYARGRDYHKVLRSRLQRLQGRMAEAVGPFGHRVFTDSAPVLEAELAARSGLGWRGKHTLVLSRDAGSLFFLGEIFVDLALPPSEPVAAHCGSCRACIDLCPTQAIVAPFRLDARRCISYLTIEHAGPIPQLLRPLIGNRIYGCDDCQLACPWNKFARRSALPDFDDRPGLSGQQLARLLLWSEDDFLRLTEGGPIRRIGHARWLRNVAVAAGNGLRVGLGRAEADDVRAALGRLLDHPDDLVREHVTWALSQDAAKSLS